MMGKNHQKVKCVVKKSNSFPLQHLDTPEERKENDVGNVSLHQQHCGHLPPISGRVRSRSSTRGDSDKGIHDPHSKPQVTFPSFPLCSDKSRSLTMLRVGRMFLLTGSLDNVSQSPADKNIAFMQTNFSFPNKDNLVFECNPTRENYINNPQEPSNMNSLRKKHSHTKNECSPRCSDHTGSYLQASKTTRSDDMVAKNTVENRRIFSHNNRATRFRESFNSSDECELNKLEKIQPAVNTPIVGSNCRQVTTMQETNTFGGSCNCSLKNQGQEMDIRLYNINQPNRQKVQVKNVVRQHCSLKTIDQENDKRRKVGPMRQHSMFEATSASYSISPSSDDSNLQLKKKHFSDPGCEGIIRWDSISCISDLNSKSLVFDQEINKNLNKKSSPDYELQESTDDEKWDDANANRRHRRLHLSPSVPLDSHDCARESPFFDSSNLDNLHVCQYGSSRNVSPAPSHYYGDSDSCERSLQKSPFETRRYSKRPLRGPYGEMLEAEMNKSKPNSQLLGEDSVPQRVSPDPSSVLAYDSRGTPPPTLPEDHVATFRLQVSPFRPLFESSSSLQSTKPFEDHIRDNYYKVLSTMTIENDKDTRLSPLPLGPIHQRTASSPSKLYSENELHEFGHLYPPQNKAPTTSSSEFPVGGIRIEAMESRENEKSLQVANNRRNDEKTLRMFGQLMRKNSAVDFRFINEHRHFPVRHHQDTRAHIIEEIYDTEKNYVDNLNFLLKRYQLPLRSSESSSIIESTLCDDIFFQIPEIHAHHERLLKELKIRLQSEESTVCIGDLLLQVLQDPSVIDCYKSFVNNWKTAQEAAKTASEMKPSFKNFLVAMAKEHPGKLDLKALLIAPVQRFPHYELILKRLIDHTFRDHPDYALVQEAISEVQKVAASINDMKQEALQLEQQQFTMKEIENSIEGLVDLVQPDRSFLQLDRVSHNSGLGVQKERCLFLFSDILVISSLKRRSGPLRKSPNLQMTLLSSLDSCKLKLFKFISLEDLEIGRSREESIKKLVKETEDLEEDIHKLSHISKLAKSLHFPKAALEESIRDHDTYLKKQLLDRQGADSPLFELELNVTSQEGIESLIFMFSNAEKKYKWEETFNVAKQKLSMSADRRPPPEFVTAIPIKKTRAGLQFTCAAPSLGGSAPNLKDIWVCNSDGYVGQVCVMSLLPEPTLVCCNGVCNAKILTIVSIPAAPQQDSSDEDDDEEINDEENVRKRRSESLPPEISATENEKQQSTMWLGTEDGFIHVYNCNDSIRAKKHKFKFQPGSPVYCLIYIENRVFASLANGDVIVYERDAQGSWSTGERQIVNLSTASSPITKMVISAGKLWCSATNVIKILNVNTLQVEHSFMVEEETSKGVACIVSSGHGVCIALHSSAAVKLYHATTHELLCEVNITSAVAKMLASCDDIIRQHKLACLKVTSLLACKDLLWVGTSAGVIITMPIPRSSHNTRRLLNVPTTVGIPHGHTGNVRFLTSVELAPESRPNLFKYHTRYSFKGKDHTYHHQLGTAAPTKLLVISGGDGYEDFRNAALSEMAGKEDSTNHLIMWKT